MEMAQAFIFDAGWLFFASWALVLAAVSIITFGRDIFRIRRRETARAINHEGSRSKPEKQSLVNGHVLRGQ
ncbi:MAG: hypothetical protein QOF56_1120 [Acidobacteriaceae bacterium]|jgi:hypothetical protein|nr:hypothetical protein [Acidobacteriaceae bacterium]